MRGDEGKECRRELPTRSHYCVKTHSKLVHEILVTLVRLFSGSSSESHKSRTKSPVPENTE